MNFKSMIAKFDDDVMNNDLKSIITYIYNEEFLKFLILFISNNPEYPDKLTSVDMDFRTKKNIFKAIFNAATKSEQQEILCSDSFEEFYELYRNSHYIFPSISDFNAVTDSGYILGTILSDMLSSETPNYDNLRYYGINVITSLEDYYNQVIYLLLKYRRFYTFDQLLYRMMKNTNYFYFFFDADEYPKYFKRVFDRFSSDLIHINIKISNILENISLTNLDYDDFVNLFYIINRLYYDNNDSFLERIPSEDEFNEFVNSRDTDVHSRYEFYRERKNFSDFILNISSEYDDYSGSDRN